MTKIYNRITEKTKRKNLRNNQTRTEAIVWNKIRRKQLRGYKFRRQFSVGYYILDFYCPRLKLAIEIDGDSHFQEGAKEYDDKRRKEIESLGIKFLRFTNKDVYENLDEVAEEISRHLLNRFDPSRLA